MDFRSFFEEQPSVWQYFKTCGKPVVLYGMGDGADKVLAAFERYGIRVSGVFASDGFAKGRSFLGFRVETYENVKNRLSDGSVNKR